jgi:uncharacterized protein YbjT (DUF2867 family)
MRSTKAILVHDGAPDGCQSIGPGHGAAFHHRGASMFVIAGASGHVGGVAAQTILAEHEPVKVIVRSPAKAQAYSAPIAEVAIGDLTDVDFLTGALQGADAFFALLPPDLGAADFYGAQRRTADAIARAVKASGVPHVVLLSSVGADLAEGNGPIKGLHYLEEALRATGTTLSAIRAGYFQENLAGAIAPAQAMGLFFNMTPSQDYPIPMIATRDIAQLVVKTLRARPAASEVIDLLGPAYSIRQQAELLGAALGKPLTIVDVPPEGQVAAMVQGGVPVGAAEAYAEMYAGFAAGAIAPRGDRLEHGTTTLEHTIAALLAAS